MTVALTYFAYQLNSQAARAFDEHARQNLKNADEAKLHVDAVLEAVADDFSVHLEPL